MALTARGQALKASLLRQLDEQPLDATPQERLSWLARQLEEYFDRWMGFVQTGSIPLKSLVASDLFEMVEIGSEVLGEEVRRSKVDPPYRIAVATLRDGLARFRQAPERSMLEEVSKLIQAVQCPGNQT